MNPSPPDHLALVRRNPDAYPAILREAGNQALFAVEEFFTARLRNPHTRRAYARAVSRFLLWCDESGLSLAAITPGDAAAFIDTLEPSVSTQKLALSALRQFFDLLVTRHAVILNPFHSVRPPRSPDRLHGKTPPITVSQTRELLSSLDTTRPAGVRDRAIIATFAFTGARIGALCRLRLQDRRDYGTHRTFLFREKGGKHREIPLRIDLDRWIAGYLDALQVADDPKDAPLFRVLSPLSPTEFGRRGVIPGTIRELLKRRLNEARLPAIITPHSFRVMVVTDLLEQNVPMEDVQYLAGHSHPSTTQIYDRRAKRVTRNIVERISV